MDLIYLVGAAAGHSQQLESDTHCSFFIMGWMPAESPFPIFSQVLSRGNIVLQGAKKLRIGDHTGGRRSPAGTQQR